MDQENNILIILIHFLALFLSFLAQAVPYFAPPLAQAAKGRGI